MAVDPEAVPPEDPDRDWVRAAADPGARDLQRAALLLVAGHAAGLAVWAGVALAVAAATTELGPAEPAMALAALAALGVGLFGRLAVTHRARRAAACGRDRIAGALRRRCLDAALPGAEVPAPVDGAAVAHGLLELVEDVADHHATHTPPRAAAAAAALLVLGAVAVVHWPAAVLLALATPILPVNAHVVGLATRAAEDAQLDALRRLSARLLDRFAGMHVLRTLGAVGRQRAEVASAADGLRRATNSVLRRAFAVGAAVDLVVTFSIAVVATEVGLTLLGYLHLPGAPHTDLTRGLFVLLAAPAYFAPLRAFAQGRHDRDRAEAAAAVLRPALHRAATPGPSPEPLPEAPRLELRGVAVAFPGAAAPVLHGVDAVVAAGVWTALEGPSGAGKSTLLDVLAGVRAPSSGEVRWDGGPPEPGRANRLGQRTVVLPGTLAENVALGDPGAPRAALLRAASRAGLDALLARLPAGLDTAVGHGGAALSAGEARRLAVARALLRDTGLWLLDEPTAHLDRATEAALLATLREVTRGRTVVVVTHSPVVAAAAEVRRRLEGGALAEPAGRTRSPARAGAGS